MDAYELRYFGLLPADMPSADSLRYGTEAGSFYIEWHYKTLSKRVLTNVEQQREFYKLIAHYEALALDPSRLSLGYMRFIKVQIPLVRHESTGRDVTMSTQDTSYYGELAFVRNGYIGLYQLDIGYRAELMAKELVIVPISKIITLRVYNRRIARYTGLGLGFAVAGGLFGIGTSPLPTAAVNIQYASNFLVFPALGFVLGCLYDVAIGTRRTYIRNYVEPNSPALIASPEKMEWLASHHSIFRQELPPEILTRITR